MKCYGKIEARKGGCMQETDIIYNLLMFLNSSKEEDMYYSICLSMLQNLEKVPNCSINELADLCYTSPATISRFSKKFGYSNFHEFKKEVGYALSQAKNEIFMTKNEVNYIDMYSPHVINKIYDLVFQCLVLGKQSLNIKEIDRVCHLIHEYDKVHFFGYQFNKVVASDIQLRLMKLGKFTYAFSDRGEGSLNIDLLDEDSLAIVMSVSGKVGHTELLKEIHKRGAKILLITMNRETPLKEFVDELFVVEGMESDFSTSSISGSIGLLTALNVIYVRYGLLYQKAAVSF